MRRRALMVVANKKNNIITYTASAKLPETTSNKTRGLHTNAFNTTIKSHTFENGVGTIEFADDVTSIGTYAFYRATTLTSIDIPNSVTSIGNHAFMHCSGLTSCTIGSGVTSIGSGAFEYCDSLTSITIPNSVTSIGTVALSAVQYLTCNGVTYTRNTNSYYGEYRGYWITLGNGQQAFISVVVSGGSN